MICVILHCENSAKEEEHGLCNAHLNIWKESPSLFPGNIKIQNVSNHTNLIEIPKKTQLFKEIEKKFFNDWVKPNADDLRIEAIYNIYLNPTIVENYKAYRLQVELRGNFKGQGLPEGNEKILYHGTDHICQIISDKTHQNNLCKTDRCGGCGILMNGFDISKVGHNNQRRTFQRLGQGLYFTPYSSKAHFYGHGGAKKCPKDNSRTCRIMFMSKVAIGNPWAPPKVSQNTSCIPAGYDSIWGRKGHCPHGSAVLNYEEYAIYRRHSVGPILPPPIRESQEYEFEKMLMSSDFSQSLDPQCCNKSIVTELNELNKLSKRNDGNKNDYLVIQCSKHLKKNTHEKDSSKCGFVKFINNFWKKILKRKKNTKVICGIGKCSETVTVKRIKAGKKMIVKRVTKDKLGSEDYYINGHPASSSPLIELQTSSSLSNENSNFELQRSSSLVLEDNHELINSPRNSIDDSSLSSLSLKIPVELKLMLSHSTDGPELITYFDEDKYYYYITKMHGIRKRKWKKPRTTSIAE
ncbi:2679_t:CDS:10 [Diversispora eburnea]|uniref:Poly [ADP-ribose] polymerase n=1 Tax=Diversispora eburnea TaxID=1213867 RepID=A0A9N9F7M3_9GLOM|nr:2679_t:CDS:10 [Diversispora eburnea]